MEAASFNAAYTQPGPPVYELSGWWRRAGAEFIDAIITGILAVILVAVLGIGGGFEAVDTGATTEIQWNAGDLVLELLVRIFAAALAMGVVMGVSRGQTFGMMATGIRVVREGGEEIDVQFGLYRETLVKTILFGYLAIFTLGIATLLNYLWPLWDDKNQALHDKICNTRVVLDRHIEKVEPFVATQPIGGPPPPPIPPPPAPADVYQPPSGFENPVPDDK